jgi:hypothetical protein
MNFNQETNDFIIDACITNTLCNMPHIPADHDSTFVTPQNKSEDNRGEEAILKNLDEADHVGQVVHETLQQDEKTRDAGHALEDLTGFTPMPLKRSKRRENSVDENTSERAERLKAIKNLDCPSTSKYKSFLSLSDECISSTIDRLGVSLGRDGYQNINQIKKIEFDRIQQAAIDKQIQNTKDSDTELDFSDDSDFELDQQAIQHLVGDIANDILGTEGSPSRGFKPGSRKSKSSSRKRKMKKKLGNHIKIV